MAPRDFFIGVLAAAVACVVACGSTQEVTPPPPPPESFDPSPPRWFAREAHTGPYHVAPGRFYASLAQVESFLAPGDVVEVEGDATYPSGVTFTRSGTSEKKITIRGIRKNGKRPRLDGGINTIEVAGSHYVIEGFEVTGGSSRCIYHHGDDLTVRDTVVHDCPSQGILGADRDSGSLTLEWVEVYRCGEGDGRHQIYMATDERGHPGSVFRMQHCFVHDGRGGNNVKSRAERNEIYANWIEGALYHEVELIGPEGEDPERKREDSDVVGNVLWKTRDSYVTRIGGDRTADTNGRYRFVNNTIVVAGGRAVFRAFDGIESVEMTNNVLYRPGGGGVRVLEDEDAKWHTGSQVIAGSHNWISAGSTAIPPTWVGTISGADPGFIDMGARDARPRPGSPLVNAGTSVTSLSKQFPFPAPLPLPAFTPPRHALAEVGVAPPRAVVGVIDIGAFEIGAP